LHAGTARRFRHEPFFQDRRCLLAATSEFHGVVYFESLVLQALHPVLGGGVWLQPALVQFGDRVLDVPIENRTRMNDVVLDTLMSFLQPLKRLNPEAQEILTIAAFHRLPVILEKPLSLSAGLRPLRFPESLEFPAIKINLAFRGPKGYDSHAAILGKVIANPLL
jgi:hypothetical protein